MSMLQKSQLLCREQRDFDAGGFNFTADKQCVAGQAKRVPTNTVNGLQSPEFAVFIRSGFQEQEFPGFAVEQNQIANPKHLAVTKSTTAFPDLYAIRQARTFHEAVGK